jgi:hypothetical protein
MVERNKKYEAKDKQKADREKKIKRAKGSDRADVKQDLRQLVRGNLDADDFADRHENK